MKKPIKSVSCLRENHLLFIICVVSASTWSHLVATAATGEIVIGFKATPDPSVSSFQPLINDSTGNFSLGFLRVSRMQLVLSVVHLPSIEPLWQANVKSLARWSDQTQIIFNGSLVLSDPYSMFFWSTRTQGDKVVLLNTSNLQIQKMEASTSVLWESFDYPTNTLVENQNFTSNMSLVSLDGRYSMRLGYDFMALYAKFKENKDQIYWKHKALEAKAKIIEAKGPIHARIVADGFLGMFQTGNTPVDVQAFNNFQRPINGFLFVRLETDGNLRGYYWDGANWVLDYRAILDTCELPNPCGSYGLCRVNSGCSCLDNGTEFRPDGGCFAVQSGDFCGEGEAKREKDYWILRRRGVELPFKELMSYHVMSSSEQCENFCENNCTCWGAVYNNASGFCYTVDYPIQTLLGVSDESKLGYFKVRNGTEKKIGVGFRVGIGFLGGAILVLIGATGFGVYRMWRRSGIKQILGEAGGISAGPYKDLGSASFRSIEMGNR